MGRILGLHPLVHTFHELHFFEQLWDPARPLTPLAEPAAIDLAARLFAVQRDGYLAPRRVEKFLAEASSLVAGIVPESRDAHSIYRAFLTRETERAGKVIPCERTPRNVFLIRHLFAIDPTARVVVMLRDPRAVLLSQKNRWRRRRLGGGSIPRWESIRNAINYHPYTIGRLWAAGAAAAAAFEGHPRVHLVRFEALTAEPDGTLRALCQSLQLEFDPVLLDVPQVGSSRQKDAPDQRGIRSDAGTAWSDGGLRSEEIRLCELAARHSMARFGYQPLNPPTSPLPMAWQWLRFPPHVVGAIVANLSRVRDPISALRRRLRPEAS
jgi:hypothetical protein